MLIYHKILFIILNLCKLLNKEIHKSLLFTYRFITYVCFRLPCLSCSEASPQTVFSEFVAAIRSHRVAMRVPLCHSPRRIDALHFALKRRANKI